jgi:hypothetical protein
MPVRMSQREPPRLTPKAESPANRKNRTINHTEIVFGIFIFIFSFGELGWLAGSDRVPALTFEIFNTLAKGRLRAGLVNPSHDLSLNESTNLILGKGKMIGKRDGVGVI